MLSRKHAQPVQKSVVIADSCHAAFKHLPIEHENAVEVAVDDVLQFVNCDAFDAVIVLVALPCCPFAEESEKCSRDTHLLNPNRLQELIVELPIL